MARTTRIDRGRETENRMLGAERADQRLPLSSAGSVVPGAAGGGAAVNGSKWDMRPEHFSELVKETKEQLSLGKRTAILGLTSVTDRVIRSLRRDRLLKRVQAIYDATAKGDGQRHFGVPLRPLELLREFKPDVLVVASDDRKEDLLRDAIPYICGTPKIIIAGYEHFGFRAPIFDEEWARLEVPSLANGYPNSAVHLYQCLANAARLGLNGVVVELGMFRGGTTMFLSRIVERLGAQWRILGFDTFDGSPPRRSPLDMYDHPDLCINDVDLVRRYLQDRNVEIVPGDIVETSRRLADEDLVLTFLDSDNFSPAKAALEIVQERTVVGGTIVFDHFAGVDRFRYTLGERMAGQVLLDDGRYFHLHDTGVFYRQC